MSETTPPAKHWLKICSKVPNNPTITRKWMAWATAAPTSRVAGRNEYSWLGDVLHKEGETIDTTEITKAFCGLTRKGAERKCRRWVKKDEARRNSKRCQAL